jgi:predicted ATP-grasp superfamily ATP-dependent carboligase
MDKAVLIAAASGRALAASARRGGYAPLVADFFGDEDTAAAAEAHIRLDQGLAHGMSSALIIAALERLASPREPAGIVCGTGFEDRPELLADIAQRWTLFGNGPAVVARTKDPLAFAKLCDESGVGHPDTSLAPPPDPANWLAKRQGGAGGRHIRNAADSDAVSRAFYFQRRVEGLPVSALFLADGHRATVLGFSAQWSAPTPSQPFRYGGAAQPAVVDTETADAMTEAVQRLTPTVQLRGLNSADFLVRGRDLDLLEINPRPGATLDIFEPSDGSLFAMHISACQGMLPAKRPRYGQARASAIVYADRNISAFPVLDWPPWTADRPAVGTSVDNGDPLCTVFACAATATSARERAAQRGAAILASTSGSLP